MERIGGLNVVVRSLLAGFAPLAMPEGPFRQESFLAAINQAYPQPRYVSLVPTQLARLLDFGNPTTPNSDTSNLTEQTIAALANFAAVLVGGAHCPADLLEQAQRAGICVVRSYGASETCGGCVYDGQPFDGVQVVLDGQGNGSHLISLGGPTVALGYVSPANAVEAQPPKRPSIVEQAGQRWFISNDLGHFDSQQRLVIDGRADDVIITGGVKVVPQVVEAVIKRLPAVADAAIVGLNHAQWGQMVSAVVVPTAGGAVTLADLRQAVTDSLPVANAPHRLVMVDYLPYRSSGKLDRLAALRLAVLADK
jgi:O-succinylbenzoic acid--CoA ligase